MFPIKDTIPSKGTPYVVYAIIALNSIVFAYEVGLGLLTSVNGRNVMELFYNYGMVPAFYSGSDLAVALFGRDLTLGEKVLPFFSSMFLHGGIMHFLGNMWVLWIFGDNVEDWFGHIGFLIFYLAGGLAAGLAHMALNLDSTVPTVGASGAIAAVMGAYFILYPRARVITAIPIIFFLYFMELPAYVFLGFWFFLQFMSGTVGGASSVAWWAHIGGFVFGAGLVYLRTGGKIFRKPGRGGPFTGGGSGSGKIDEFWK